MEARMSPEAANALADQWSDRARMFFGRFSVRTKIIGIVLALTAVLGLGTTQQVRRAMSDVASSELNLRGESISLEVAIQVSEPFTDVDIPAVVEILERTISSHPDAIFAKVSRLDGTVVATAGNTHESAPGTQNAAGVNSRTVFDGIHTFSAPTPSNDGMATVSLSDARLTRTVNTVTLQLLITTLFVGTIGVVAASVMTWLLTRPILDLVKSTEQVSRGDLTVRTPVAAEDEIGALAGAFNRMVEDLEANERTIAETERARSRLLKQLIRAQEDERKRIARELHDGVGQSLSSIMLSANLIAQSAPSTDASDRAIVIRDAAAESLKQVRRLGRELRPSVLDDLGLASALERHTAEFQLRYPKISTEFHSDLTRRVPPIIETTMYRVTQEAMTNVARHSGAGTLSVLVAERDGVVQAIIEDDGNGFDAENERANAHSVGIHGMVERVELLGGRLGIESSRSGTTIYAEVPTK
jgi:signal transduction histidine kinase